MGGGKHTLKNINDQQDLLKALGHCKLKIRKAILNNADKDLVDAICQCVFNLLQGNLDLTQAQKTELNKYRHTLRKLVQKSSLKTKKKILSQHGGFLQYLIPAAISGISQIISSLVENKSSDTS